MGDGRSTFRRRQLPARLPLRSGSSGCGQALAVKKMGDLVALARAPRALQNPTSPLPPVASSKRMSTSSMRTIVTDDLLASLSSSSSVSERTLWREDTPNKPWLGFHGFFAFCFCFCLCFCCWSSRSRDELDRVASSMACLSAAPFRARPVWISRTVHLPQCSATAWTIAVLPLAGGPVSKQSGVRRGSNSSSESLPTSQSSSSL
mmetsp:Transcript_23749/g.55901  ORF Transcript_23749/g.55901 Transcript_23749/m.55901 type:complete len:205 (-) Transcript_23749:1258-1872(-)